MFVAAIVWSCLCGVLCAGLALLCDIATRRTLGPIRTPEACICGYPAPQDASDDERCPECGRRVGAAKVLVQNRARRRSNAVSGMLTTVGWFACIVLLVSWTPMINSPSTRTALVLLVPAMPLVVVASVLHIFWRLTRTELAVLLGIMGGCIQATWVLAYATTDPLFPYSFWFFGMPLAMLPIGIVFLCIIIHRAGSPR